MQGLHLFLRQQTETQNLYTLTELFLIKQAEEGLANHLDALYSLINFYIVEDKHAKAKEAYTSIAAIYPDVILAYVVEDPEEIWFVDSLFTDLGRLHAETSASYRSSDYPLVTDPGRMLILAEGLVLQGEYKTSYRHLNDIIRAHRSQQDLNLNSESDYVNLLLGLSYMSWSRGGSEIVPGLKYLHKAYELNPQNPITNNALGHYYYNRYENHWEKFSNYVPERLTQEELILKVVGYYEEAIGLDPDYRRAWGNLGKIISSAGYKPEVADALRDVYPIPEGRHIAYEPEFKELKDSCAERSMGRNGLPVDGVESVKSFGEHVR